MEHVALVAIYSPTISTLDLSQVIATHDDVIKWKHFPRYWTFVRGIHRSAVNSIHKGQWRGAFMFSLICARIKGWVNNGEAGDLRRYRVHYDVIVMSFDDREPRMEYLYVPHIRMNSRDLI